MKNEILKNFNLVVDGQGYAGMADEVIPPKLAIKTEETRMGGMDAPIDMDVGMEKLVIEFTLAGFPAAMKKRFGLLAGQSTSVTLKGAAEDRDGTIHSEVINATGKIVEVDEGNWKAGSNAQTKVKVSLNYYKRSRDGEVLVEIDVENAKRIIGGEDQLAGVRDAIGL